MTDVRPHLRALTALRFLAAFWVLGFHAMPRGDAMRSPWRSVWDAGYLGVSVFFVLSGFVLVYTYRPAADGAFRLREFFVARFARVYPMYAAALLFAIPEFVHVARGGANHVPLTAPQLWTVVVATPALLQAWVPGFGSEWNTPGWSLSAEAFFYALFPLLSARAIRSGDRRLLVLFAITWAAALGAGWVQTHPDIVWAPLTGLAGSLATPLLRLPEFVAGMVAGRWMTARADRFAPSRWSAILATLASATILGGVAALPFRPQGILIGAAMLPVFVMLVVTLARVRSGLLTSAAAVLLGEASYALYIIHGPLHGYSLAVAERIAPGLPARAPVVVFLCYSTVGIVAAVVLFRIYEEPARRRIRARFFGPSARRPAAGRSTTHTGPAA